ncbi:hypothetical protein [Streptomyces sp. NRRL F-5630]|uniref:hypothetical protein n=1 Tax=Streptomyces sp. NRRL F-5630 TaxID=1463864 RepID=UPI003EB8FC6B
MRHFPVPLRLAAVLAATLAGTGCMNVGDDPAGSSSAGATAGVAHESPDGGALRAVPQGDKAPGRARPGGARPGASGSPSPSSSARPAAKDPATPADDDRPGRHPSRPAASRPDRPDRPAPPTHPAPTGRPSTPAPHPTPTRTRPPEPPTSAPPTPEPSDTPGEPQESDPGEDGDAVRTHQREQRAPDQPAEREQGGGAARSDQYTPAP